VLSAMAYKNLMGSLAVAIMLVAYGVQLWKTYEGKSEPHPIAWFGFGFLTAIGFFVQWQKGAGPGSWVMGVTAVFCFLVGAMSQYKRRWRPSDFDRWDWASLVGGGSLFGLYLISRDLSWGPLVSACLATTADLVLYWPIFKKGWILPGKENATAYGLNSLKFVPSLFAMDAYSVETYLYPAAMVVINAIVVFFLLWRRRQLRMLAP
jgi:hypothetical protein